MKKSKYTIEVQIDKNTYMLYNTMTREYSLYSQSQRDSMLGLLENLNKSEYLSDEIQIIKEWLDRGIIIDETVDEIKRLERLENKVCYQNRIFYMTIYMTNACNFRCVYCEQNHIVKHIEMQTMKKIADLVKVVTKKSKVLRINWFGGEPLLRCDDMKSLLENIIEIGAQNKCEIISFISTNGYLLSEMLIKELKGKSVAGMQITLDGTQEVHDRRRYLCNGDGTYRKILENICEALRQKMQITLRVNIDGKNIKDVSGILDEIPEEYREQVTISISNVFQEKNKISVFPILKRAIEKGYKYSGRYNSYAACTASMDNSLVIDTDGSLLLCTNTDETCPAIGYLGEGGKVHLKRRDLRDSILATSAIKNQKCKTCIQLPICIGGCKYCRIWKNEECMGKSNDGMSLEERAYLDYYYDIYNKKEGKGRKLFMSEQTEKINYKVIFHQKEYMKMILATLVNRFGDSIDAIASAWIVYELTNNAAWSAVIFGVNKLPSVLITPFAGAWVEGRNKKGVMVVTDFIRGACVAFVATGYLLGFLQAWQLILTTLVISTAEAFRGPAGTALTPKILEKKYYEYAMSLMSALSTAVELIGTAVAAGIIAWLGTAGAIYVDMATFFLSAIIIMLVRSGETTAEKQKFSGKEYLATFQSGIRYVKGNKLVRFFLGLCIFLNAILVPFNSLQAPLAEEILQGGAEILSILGIALTAGMMVGSAVYPVVRKVLNTRIFVFLGGVCIGLYYVGLIVCKPLYGVEWFRYGFVMVMSVLFGLFITLLMAFMQVEFIKSVEEEYLARASAILSSFGSAATPIASFLLGAVMVFASTEIVFAVIGIVDIAICLLLLRSKVLGEIAEDAEAETEAA